VAVLNRGMFNCWELATFNLVIFRLTWAVFRLTGVLFRLTWALFRLLSKFTRGRLERPPNVDSVASIYEIVSNIQQGANFVIVNRLCTWRPRPPTLSWWSYFSGGSPYLERRTDWYSTLCLPGSDLEILRYSFISRVFREILIWGICLSVGFSNSKLQPQELDID